MKCPFLSLVVLLALIFTKSDINTICNFHLLKGGIIQYSHHFFDKVRNQSTNSISSLLGLYGIDVRHLSTVYVYAAIVSVSHSIHVYTLSLLFFYYFLSFKFPCRIIFLLTEEQILVFLLVCLLVKNALFVCQKCPILPSFLKILLQNAEFQVGSYFYQHFGDILLWCVFDCFVEK